MTHLLSWAGASQTRHQFGHVEIDSLFFFNVAMLRQCHARAHSNFPSVASPRRPVLGSAATMESRFLAQHVARVAKLCTAMYTCLVQPDAGEYLARTGSLLRDRHLRTKKNRIAFRNLIEQCHEGEDQESCRFWTHSVVRHAISRANTKFIQHFSYHFSDFG